MCSSVSLLLYIFNKPGNDEITARAALMSTLSSQVFAGEI